MKTFTRQLVINQVQKNLRSSLSNIIKLGVDKDVVSKATQQCLSNLKDRSIIEGYVVDDVSVEIIGANDSPEEIMVREIMEEESDEINVKCTISPKFPFEYIKIDLKI